MTDLATLQIEIKSNQSEIQALKRQLAELTRAGQETETTFKRTSKSSEDVGERFKRTEVAGGFLEGKLAKIVRIGPQIFAADIVARVLGFRNVMDLLDKTMDKVAEGVVLAGRALIGLNDDVAKIEAGVTKSSEALEKRLDALIEKYKEAKGIVEVFPGKTLELGAGAADPRVLAQIEKAQKALKAFAETRAEIDRATFAGTGAGGRPTLVDVGALIRGTRPRTGEEVEARQVEALKKLKLELGPLLLLINKKAELEGKGKTATEGSSVADEQYSKNLKAQAKLRGERIRDAFEESRRLGALGRALGLFGLQMAEVRRQEELDAALRPIIAKANEEDAEAMRRDLEIAKQRTEAEKRQVEAAKDLLEETKHGHERAQEQILDLQDQVGLLGMTGDALQKATMMRQLDRMATDEQIESYKKLVDQWVRENKIRQAADDIGAAFGNALGSAAQDFKNLGEVAVSIIRSIEQEMLRLLVIKPASDWLSGLLQGSSFFGNLFGGPAQAHAGGGMIDEPMIARGRSGRWHTFGEAGPERVTPMNQPMQPRAAAPVVMNIYTNNADSFRRSRRHIAADYRRAALGS